MHTLAGPFCRRGGEELPGSKDSAALGFALSFGAFRLPFCRDDLLQRSSKIFKGLGIADLEPGEVPESPIPLN